jgi:putative ABC transport system permease protein
MKTLLKISWRNVWRNKGRSLAIIIAISIGLWGGIFATSISTGLINQQFESSINTRVSHIQIHNPDFIKEKNTKHTIQNTQEIIKYLNKSDKVLAYCSRILNNGMLLTANSTSGINIYGIDADTENKTTKLKQNTIEGNYLDSIDSRNPILIGASLASKKKISIGNRIILTFQDVNGEIISASFKVCGIYRTANSTLDELNVYVKKSDFSKLLGKEDISNEIAILLHDFNNAEPFKEELQDIFTENEIRTWAEVSPDLSYTKEMTGVSLMVLIIIILGALGFGLLNTMLMTIFERTNELGVLLSVGMNKIKVFLMILFETSYLILSGSFIGIVLSLISINLANKTGLDFSSTGAEIFEQYGFEAIIYPEVSSAFYLQIVVLVILTAIIATVYPAYKALKLNPAEAVRKE